MSTRRRAAAADSTAQPLDGYKIVLSGKFNHLGHTQGSLEKLVRTLGGSTSNSVTSTTTHVVCTEFDYNAGSKKIDAAKSSDKPLLDPQWVIDAEGKASAPDEAQYSWAARANAPQSNGIDSQKRKQDDADGSQGKKKTKAKAKAQAADEDEDEEMEDAPQPAKTNGKAKANGKVNGKSKAKAKAEPEEEKEEEEEEEEEEKPKVTKSRGRSKAKAKAEPEPEPEEEEEEEKPKATKAKGRSKAKAKAEPEEEEEEEQKPKATKAKGKSKAKAKAEPEVKADELEEEKIVAEGQFIKKKGIEIPVDSHSPHFFDHKVYVDPDSGMIWDASLNQTNASNNNNKWGRVGEIGQSATLPEGTLENAIKGFEKKFKDKSGLPWDKRGENPKPGKYAFVERSYNPDSDDDEEDADEGDSKKVKKEEDDAPVECTLEQPIQDLVSLIFNQSYFQAAMSSLNYDANKLPLGKLSKSTITRGFQQLKDLAALIDDPSLANSQWQMSLPAAKEHLSNTFYSLIPHAFGRNRPPIISDNTLLKKEIELLESLSDMKDAADIMKIDRKAKETVHPLDLQFQGLGLREMTTLDHSSVEFKSLKNYLCESRGATHSYDYKVEQIWRIERQGEKDRFDQSEYAKMDSDRRLLWHGSRCTNFGGILSQGLRIAPPEAPVSGYMFGKGIYLADMSSKSAGYCASYISNGHILLLLCEAELGNPMQTLTQASYQAGETAKQNGMVSTWGQGNTGPSKWVDAGDVHESLKGIKMPDPDVKAGPTNVQNASLFYNEYICYDVAQVRLRYLFRVKV
ncbi:unnamed protein product [Clonostachys rosea]|uniref:Poly [ADP-ribose] polymerase n=1 Tax=Bionectria ochroleuca TaxID=29856 RepID=A0ABY6TTF3_BIOOC|nr:unnamed protein product [Clonostachys rosea]